MDEGGWIVRHFLPITKCTTSSSSLSAKRICCWQYIDQCQQPVLASKQSLMLLVMCTFLHAYYIIFNDLAVVETREIVSHKLARLCVTSFYHSSSHLLLLELQFQFQ